MEMDPKRILIIENMLNWQDLLETILKNEGYSVQIAASYGEGLGELRRKRFDLAVIDIRLSPGDIEEDYSGMLLVEEARIRRIPTIVLSKFGTRELENQAIKRYRVVSFINKDSFDSDRFRGLVKEVIAPWSLVDWIKERAHPIIDNLIAAIMVGIVTQVLSWFGVNRGWLPRNAPAYIAFSVIAALLILVASIAWQRHRQ